MRGFSTMKKKRGGRIVFLARNQETFGFLGRAERRHVPGV